MKRDFLEGLSLEKVVIDKIMAENGRDIEKFKSEALGQQEKIKGLKERLEEAENKVREYNEIDIESIEKKAREWEEKYNNEIALRQKEKADMEYDGIIKGSLEGMRFSSNLAREAVISKIKERGLEAEDGKLKGFDEFLSQLKAEDSGAFIEDETVARVNFGINLGGESPVETDRFFSTFRAGAGLKEE